MVGELVINDGRIKLDKDICSVSYDSEGIKYWDDMSGKALKEELVKVARSEEMRYFKEYGVYKKVPETECWYHTGKGPIGVRWVDINKGDELNPE